MFKPPEFQSAPQRIINQIRTAILEGKIYPGERLQSERELMTAFGVSKATMREALRTLEYMGLVEIRKGVHGGVFASQVDMNVTKESLVNFLQFKNVCIQDWSEVRRVLGPYAVRIAAHVMNDEELERLKDINKYCQASLALGKEDEVINGLVQFHRAIARCTENPILVLILSFIEGLMEDTKNILKPQNKILKSVIESHVSIYKALKKRDAEKAAQLMCNSIVQVERDLIKTKNKII